MRDVKLSNRWTPMCQTCYGKFKFSKVFKSKFPVKFRIIPKMTSHRLSVVEFEIKISRYF